MARSRRPPDKGSSPCTWPASSFVLRPSPAGCPSLRHKLNLPRPHSDRLSCQSLGPSDGLRGCRTAHLAHGVALNGRLLSRRALGVSLTSSGPPPCHQAAEQNTAPCDPGQPLSLSACQSVPSRGNSLLGLPEATPGSPGPARDWSNCSMKPQDYSYSHIFFSRCFLSLKCLFPFLARLPYQLLISLLNPKPHIQLSAPLVQRL